jgi:hypothetical protein
MTDIKVGNITNSIGVSIGGNVGGQVIISGGNITVDNTEQSKPDPVPCRYCMSKVVPGHDCEACGGPNPITPTAAQPGGGGE